jgi:NRAMP (natural resistance-associated macrophage protein)-like metal ion transporter
MARGTAVLDAAHEGDIQGALGSLRAGDLGPRAGWGARLRTLLAILGPGLIVMVGDNDAGAFSVYTQAGQNYGTSLLWTLALLIPVLYVNQEMVLRLGAVSRVGHARLILERFGRFWGAFSVLDLLLLNALTIVTEFIGISLGLGFLGVPKVAGVAVAALLVMLAASTGSFRRFERFALTLVAGSLVLLPILWLAHPSWRAVAHGFLVPGLPAHAAPADAMLLIIGIVGTTVAPWQLFFQQSYVIDKRITSRFIRYERVDLIIGIVLVIAGAAAMMAFCSAAFSGQPEFGHFRDAGAVAFDLSRHLGRAAGIFFAVALIDAGMIGAAAVSLSTAYALGDVLSVGHSLHRGPRQSGLFHGTYCVLIAAAAALVLVPGVPLGLLTNAVQTLAGVLLPSATVFLLLLCNDSAVLGPWVNSRRVNLFTMVVIGLLITLSLILTAAVLFPHMNSRDILWMLAAGVGASVLGTLAAAVLGSRERPVRVEQGFKLRWQMPPLESLPALPLSRLNRLWLTLLRGYLFVGVALVAWRVYQLASGRGS